MHVISDNMLSSLEASDTDPKILSGGLVRENLLVNLVSNFFRIFKFCFDIC